MRRALVLGFGAVVAIVAAVASVALLQDDSARGPRESRVATALVARNASALATLGLPPGWEQLANADTTEPVEVLVVGTAARPEEDPIGGCDPSATLEPDSAFVSIYEYPTGARLNSPDHQFVYDTTQFISRPADFALVAPSGPMSCPQPIPVQQLVPPNGDGPLVAEPLPPVGGDRVAEYTFLDTGRFFVARVVVAGDPDGARYEEAISVLNSLDITPPPEVTTTSDPGATPTSIATPGDAQAVANQEVTDALRGAFGGGGPRSGDDAIAGGFPLGEAAKVEARKGNESFIGVIVPRLNWLTLDTATHATINFDLLIDGRTITANTTSEALFLDGSWRITAEAFCVVARRGNVTCPAR